MESWASPAMSAPRAISPPSRAASSSRSAPATKRWRIAVDAPPEAKVVGVPHGLDTLLRNLIENAASFALPVGEAPARVVVKVVSEAASVRVRVTDSGPGIPADALDRVFTRFFTTRRARGTGLGLALVRAVAEAHGGEVKVTSEPGCGATFEVVLPRSPPG